MKPLIKPKKVISLLICLILLATPAMAATVTATQINQAVQQQGIKELKISEQDPKFKELSEHGDLKLLEKTLLKGNYKIAEKRMFEIIDPSDNKPVHTLVIPFVQDNKPGIMGIVTKNGITYAGALQGESSDSKTVDIRVFSIDQDKKVISKVKKVNKVNKESNVISNFIVPPAYAYDTHTFCIDFCNAMCSMGIGFVGCTLLCDAMSAGTGLLLCPFLCASFTWAACNYGCPWYCQSIGF